MPRNKTKRRFAVSSSAKFFEDYITLIILLILSLAQTSHRFQSSFLVGFQVGLRDVLHYDGRLRQGCSLLLRLRWRLWARF